jgi:hypothetical protein
LSKNHFKTLTLFKYSHPDCKVAFLLTVNSILLLSNKNYFMKNFKILTIALLSVMLTIGACAPDDTEDNTPKFEVTEVTMTPSANATEVEINGKIKVKNISSATVNLYWARKNVNIPSAWETAVCDHELCYPNTVGERDLILEAGQEVELKAVFRPNGLAGTGSVDLSVYEKGKQSTTEKTFTFTATAR